MKLLKLRDSSTFKAIAVFIAINFLSQIAFPTVAFALTSGPSQPEVQSFEPVGTTEMVDLFTGDFTYNIPLFELPGPDGGYPFNLAYHSGIGMDQEASWVGLGWNLNPGAINRSMRGLPDDYNGEKIKKTIDMKDNITYGVGVGSGSEFFGSDNFVSLSGQLRVYHNNYRGVGYTLAPSIALGANKNFSGGLGLSLDSQEGVGANASVSLQAIGKNNTLGLTGGIGFNSKRGVDLSLTGYITNQTRSHTFRDGSIESGNSASASMGGGSTYSFSESAYTPLVSMPMRNRFIDVRIKTGIGGNGLFGNLSFSGFYNTQYLTNAGETVAQQAYGYNYLENSGNDDLLDFNRYKDGEIRKESPNLAIPNLTYDYYNVTGQGTGGMYRPYRSDVGVLHDPKVESNTFGGALGADVGPTDHYGGSASVTSGSSSSGVWNDANNPLASLYAFRGAANDLTGLPYDDEVYEPLYYKMHGEMTSFQTDEMDEIGGDLPLRAVLGKDGQTKATMDYLVDRSANPYPAAANYIRKSSVHGRMPRNTSVQPLTNEQMGGNNEVIGEYDINFYSNIQSGAAPYTQIPSTPIERHTDHDFQNDPFSTHDIDNHVGGVTSVNTDGVRYVYGLPAYNNVDETYNFSVENTSCASAVNIPNDGTNIDYDIENTNEYFDKTELPAYAYSYLLTSVLGNDYVDSDATPGPSDNDMGYWVKFNYVKACDNYKWRAPFLDANYNRGLASAAKDNTASFKYGEKEVFHVATAETKTHIAVFHLSERADAKGAYERFNGSTGNTTMGASSYKLDKISLYVKKEYQTNGANATPIKEVHFTYNYSLCTGALNSSSGGKLTLEKVYFTYQHNKRGELNPYQFNYAINPGYSTDHYDRWGNYRANLTGGDYCDDIAYPYVDQFDEGANQALSTVKEVFQIQRNNDASAWHLSSIKLPTGGTINVDYEADDYGYVQHKQAQQMFKVDHLEFNNDNQIYDKNNQDPGRKVYFKLENPVSSVSEFHKQYIKDLLVDGKYQMYYKIKVNLRDNLWEYVSGYANIEDYGVDIPNNLGWVKLEKMNINGTVNFHPFAVASWQHMRTMQPDLLVTVGSASSSEIGAVKSLASIFPEIVKVFKGYRDFCADKEFANKIALDNSYIRLCTPDKKKFGGGQRVKQIEITDEWSGEGGATNSYGQVYDYTMQEGGQTISSGVAQYEPMIGADENALRYAKNYPQSIPAMTDNNLFFEYPINESYYPAPLVGYRKVTVRSLPTADVMAGNNPEIPTTGVTEHEFYTAKDYPVITDETDIKKSPFNLYIPIPLIGQINVSNMTASQGYSIKLNDMHGKPKSVKSYAMDCNGNKIPSSISSVEYYYKDKVKSYQGKTVKELDNDVEVILDEFDGVSAAETEARTMGVEYEFFTDMRKNRSEMDMGGLQANTELIGFTIAKVPIPVPWPTVNTSTNDLSTVVTNKIIHKAGILEKTIATDGQSTVVTENMLHDAQTGRVLLASVTNDYDDPVYKYDLPAHWKYDGMGAAYKNWGLKFDANFTASTISDVYNATNLTTTIVDNLEPGDEFIVNNSVIAIYLGETRCNSEQAFYCASNLSGSGKNLYLYRSGKRNQLTTDVSNILALDNPTQNIIQTDCGTYTNSGPNQYTITNGWLNLWLLMDGLLNHPDSKSSGTVGSNFCDQGAGEPIEISADPILFSFYNQTMLSNVTSTPFFIYLPPANVQDPPYIGRGHFHTNCRHTGGFCSELPSGQSCPISDLFGGNYWEYIVPGSTPTSINDFTINQSTGEVTYSFDVLISGNQSTLTNTTSGFCMGGCYEPATEVLNCPIPTYNVYSNSISNVLQIAALEATDNFEPNTNITFDGLLTDNTEIVPDAYVTGAKGVWRAKRTFNYFSDRKSSLYEAAGDHDTKIDGILCPSIPFPEGKTPGGTPTDCRVALFNFQYPDEFLQCEPHWKPTNEVTKYNDAGFEVENLDILGVYSSAKYGFDNTLPTVVTNNARFDETYFESFEEDGTLYPANEQHTGLRSIAVNGTGTPIATDIKPTEGKAYMLSAWIKWPTSTKGFTYKVDPGATQTNHILVEFLNGSSASVGTPVSIEPVGEVIDGWQKVEAKFIVPTGLGVESISITPNAAIIGSSHTVYYDDIRIFPSEASINTHVYNPVTYRLQATLDDNNYATLYYYDEEGNLFLVKKETEKGIKTIQESRNHLQEYIVSGSGGGSGGGSGSGGSTN